MVRDWCLVCISYHSEGKLTGFSLLETARGGGEPQEMRRAPVRSVGRLRPRREYSSVVIRGKVSVVE